jgi:uncharacterized membrane protein YhaH (DUF805 family)
MTLRDKLFSFDGRLRRRDWWICTISSGIVFVALASLFALATGGFVRTSSWYLTASFGDPLPQLLSSVALYAPLVFVQAALAAKRAHDRNQGARLVILLVLVSAILSFMPDDGFATLGRLADEGAVWAWFVMAAAVVGKASSLYLFVVLGFLDGTPGPNRFGLSPKRRSGGAPAFTAPGGLE